jgi:hypothetical protein
MSGVLISLRERLRRVAHRLAIAVWAIVPRPMSGLVRREDRRLSLGERLHTLRARGATDAPSPAGTDSGASVHAVANESAPIALTSKDVGISDDISAMVTPLWPEVDLIAVPPVFDEANDARILHLLQIRPKSKLLDLRRAEGKSLSVAWFERLAAGWHAPGAAVPRLGIVLDLERWALWETVILRVLRPVADHGVEVRVFYAQQVHQLRAWFVGGEVRHNLDGVLSWIRDEWPALRASGVSPAIGPPRAAPLGRTGAGCEEPWALVLRRIARLVDDHANVEHVPHVRLELARIAQTFSEPAGTAEALHHLSAALYWLGDAPSQLKCRVLRAQAAAKVERDEVADALRRLDQATVIALNIHDPHEAMLALVDGGRYALRWKMYARAERRLRRALEIATPEHSAELRADVQHLLARVLFEQDRVDEAALRYAKTALSPRTDTTGPAADGDRVLLAEISGRPATNPGSSTVVRANSATLPRARSEGA